jgi:uncharacterized protein (TIGR03435 family)
MPVLYVDSVNQKPTYKSPDEMKSFPPVPTEFDAAEIKPNTSWPSGRGSQTEIKNGRLISQGISLQSLIIIGWDLPSPDELIGAPRWLSSDRFDLIAKAPAGVALGDLTAQNSRAVSINVDAIRPMVKTLLVERFKLAAHTEERPLPRFVLSAVKPKFQKADPTARTKWSNGSAGDSRDPRDSNPALARLVNCQNVTMAQFAELLPAIAPGYIRTQVIDATGLEGGWDFTLIFSTAVQVQSVGGRSGAGAGGADAALDPNGGLSLYDAISKQLGLKLEQQKRPAPVLVIDHVEQKPTVN